MKNIYSGDNSKVLAFIEITQRVLRDYSKLIKRYSAELTSEQIKEVIKNARENNYSSAIRWYL